ncbi:insulin-like receptor [Athalia rosae]|uniref:insulin-like receptor n=1 Tax=Athalia rosae TaxID=37344 RepID=UPI002033A189|nr:insulin-like receptor [Athalia rosae]
MRAKKFFIIICILTSVLCEEKDELRKANAVPRQRDKTSLGKYNGGNVEEKETNTEFAGERKSQPANEDLSINRADRSNAFLTVLGNIENTGNASSSVAKNNNEQERNPLSKTEQQSTQANRPTSNHKANQKWRGKYGSPKEVTIFDGICPPTDIRNSVDNFNRIKDCVVIEGFLQIVLIDRDVNETTFENVTFPKLREITGYLLFYRVNGLKSLTNLFPNLEVIRGQTLITDYALMVYEMPNLQELGLKKLTEITRGGVRIEKNPSLCYVNTVNWTLIVNTGETFIKFNKNEGACPGCQQCNPGHCWTSKHCQVTLKPECHSECLGWCTGPANTDCYVCKHFRHAGKCVKQCPPNYYGYLDRRCITEEECLNMNRTVHQIAYSGVTKDPNWRPFRNSCISQCPIGFEDFVDDDGMTKCRECSGPCRRVLAGETIRNMADAQRYRGIDVVQGGLEFHIENGNWNIMNELAESFGSIEEITGHLKVMHSFPITSLAFFKKLKVIKGDPPDTNNASLTILDNPNLSNLFQPGQEIRILNGRLFFHYNPKLCFSKIESLGHMVGIQNFSKVEVDPESNGEKVACNIVNININVTERGPDFVTIAWNSYVPSDGQRLLGYILNYMETENKNITVFDSNFCSNNTWQSVDVDIPNADLALSVVSKMITDLKPYTSYAIYVKTYTFRNENAFVSPVGQSEINFFRTKSDIPSPPTNLSSFPVSDTEIMVRWGPPDLPNGPIAYYLISGFVRKDDREYLEVRDYCKFGLVDEATEPAAEVEVTEKVEVNVNDPPTKSCCMKDLLQTKPTAPKKFEIMCHENMSISMLIPGKKSFCRSSGVDYIKPVIAHGKYEAFSFNVSATNNSYLVKNLTHFSLYTISVGACGPMLPNNSEQCSEVQYTSTRTSKKETADDIHNLQVVVSNNTIVTVSWDPIPSPNGLTVAYTIEYISLHVKDAVKSTECVPEKKIRAKRNKHDIANLSPGKYSVRVRSMSLAGDGAFSEMVEFVVQVPENNSVGVAVGLCFAILAVAVVFVLCLIYKRRQNRMKQIRLIASVNPDYIETKYVIDDWEVPREDVEILEELGLGNFGMVYRGVLNGTRNVAVKTISENANLREKNEFLNEASVMKNFSTFHIIRLLGVVSVGTPPFVIMELMENGDLKTYLRKIRDTHLVPNFTRISRMAAEIADGMAYLESKKFVHRDLAARNCMVSKDLVCKIGDFGMARDIYETDYYKIGKKGLLPIRWMAPENLSDGVFTSDSDVWSYGVVLYEILTLAEIPYQGFSNEEVLNYVLRKGTVDIPKNCPEVIFKIMERCFKWRPNDRPTFLEIISELEPFLAQDFCTTSFYHSSEGVEIRNSGAKKVYHNAAPISFYFGNETARWVKDFEDNVMLLDQTKAGSSRGRIFKNGFQQFGNLSTMEDVSLDR